ncbi:hypothetical protein AA313_de0204377 [Arthrobotrys entomopaga]|nr:hypothetical protein AA313_de0204377 [Arthrobotrys entomopaga]
MSSGSGGSTRSLRVAKSPPKEHITPYAANMLTELYEKANHDKDLFLALLKDRADSSPLPVKNLKDMRKEDTLRIFNLHQDDPDIYFELQKPKHDVVVPSRLTEFIRLHREIAWRDSEAVCRTLVDAILQEGIAIVSGIDPKFDIKSSSTDQQLQLVGEVDLEYEDENRKLLYTGRFDHGVGIFPSEEMTNPCERNSGLKPYHSIVAVVEAKDENGVIGVRRQLLAYLACIYKSRVERGKKDATTFGIATDGLTWGFSVIRHDRKVT